MKTVSKKTLICFFVIMTACLTILSGCSGSKKDDNLLAADDSITQAMATSSQINVRLYKYDIGVTDKPVETALFAFNKDSYESDTLNLLNEIFAEDELSFSDAKLDLKNKCITADITQNVVSILNSGKESADAVTSEIVVTLLNMPGIEKAVITIDGKKDCSGPYYNFKGTFVKTGDITFKRDEGTTDTTK